MSRTVTLKQVGRFTASSETFSLPAVLTSFAFNDGGQLGIGCNDGSFHILSEPHRPDALISFSTSHSIILALASREKTFIIGGDAGSVDIYSDSGKNKSFTLDGGWVENIVSNPLSGVIFATTARSGIIYGNHGIFSIPSLSGAPTAIAIDSTGRRCAVASRKGFSIWNETGENIAVHETRGALRGLSWGSDDRYLVAAMQEGDLYCWQLTDDSDVLLAATTGPFTKYEWSSDSRWLAAISKDELTLFYSAPRGLNETPLFTFSTPDKTKITSLMWHPFLTTLCFGTEGGTLWAVSLPEGVICKVATLSAIDAMHWTIDGSSIYVGAGTEISVLTPETP